MQLICRHATQHSFNGKTTVTDDLRRHRSCGCKYSEQRSEGFRNKPNLRKLSRYLQSDGSAASLVVPDHIADIAAQLLGDSQPLVDFHTGPLLFPTQHKKGGEVRGLHERPSAVVIESLYDVVRTWARSFAALDICAGRWEGEVHREDALVAVSSWGWSRCAVHPDGHWTGRCIPLTAIGDRDRSIFVKTVFGENAAITCGRERCRIACDLIPAAEVCVHVKVFRGWRVEALPVETAFSRSVKVKLRWHLLVPQGRGDFVNWLANLFVTSMAAV